jgi:hypothetical protein
VANTIYEAAMNGDLGAAMFFLRSRGSWVDRNIQAKALANGRCKNYGGLSTGPKTVEGRAQERGRIQALLGGEAATAKWLSPRR